MHDIVGTQLERPEHNGMLAHTEAFDGGAATRAEYIALLLKYKAISTSCTL